MDEKEQNRGRGALLRIFLAFALLVVVYFGSVGPAWKLQERGWFRHTGVHAFYGPAEWVVDRSPTLQRFSWWYIHDVWKVRQTL
jgi:hypothetical protein